MAIKNKSFLLTEQQLAQVNITLDEAHRRDSHLIVEFSFFPENVSAIAYIAGDDNDPVTIIPPPENPLALGGADPYLLAARWYGLYRDQYLAALQEFPAHGALLLRDVRARFRSVANELYAMTGHSYESILATQQIGQPFHKEHAVPLNRIHNLILGVGQNPYGEAGDINLPAQLAEFLRYHIVVVHVTPQEHGQLNAFNMPTPWAWWGDVLARYHAAGIAVAPVPQ